MAFDPEDQEIIRLLNKLKDAEGEYPKHMLVARRGHFLKRIGEVGLGIPAKAEIQDAAKDVKASHISPTTSALVETALVVAIIAEATTVAYFYRDRLADFFRRAVRDQRVQEVTPPPVIPTSFEILQEISPTPALTVTVPSSTIWSPSTPTEIPLMPTSTPIPGVIPDVVDNNNSITTAATAEVSVVDATPGPIDSSVSNGNNGINTIAAGEANVVNATPGPSDSSGNNGNNGNHYGQTPWPERTKENGNNPSPPNDNNGRPHQDNENNPP